MRRGRFGGAAHESATARSRVVLMKPFSMAPRTPKALAVQNSSGRRPLAMPR
jgi:hypothetical protein